MTAPPDFEKWARAILDSGRFADGWREEEIAEALRSAFAAGEASGAAKERERYDAILRGERSFGGNT